MKNSTLWTTLNLFYSVCLQVFLKCNPQPVKHTLVLLPIDMKILSTFCFLAGVLFSWPALNENFVFSLVVMTILFMLFFLKCVQNVKNGL